MLSRRDNVSLAQDHMFRIEVHFFTLSTGKGRTNDVKIVFGPQCEGSS
jgi:hypothetical protein